VSDVRALVIGRDVEVGDGAYLERLDRPVHAMEEWLRDIFARLASGSANPTNKFVRQVNALENGVRVKPDVVLRGEIAMVATEMQRQGFRDDLLAEGFAIIREAGRRTLGKRHHDVQLLAGYTLLKGMIAEMATGEGKTLAATLGVCTAAATGASVHVVTVNDYLAERDAEENLALYEFFGFTVGVVKQDMPVEERRAQYARNVVYVSNKELTFDYLKDVIAWGGTLSAQMKLRQLQRLRPQTGPLLRGLHVAIVDEADSVLIDEARTPLIISETLPDDLDESVYHQAISIAQRLAVSMDYVIGKDRDIWLTAAGLSKISGICAELGSVWRSALWQKELIQKALSALHTFHRDQHYIIADNKVQIVDEFTGRVMPDRTWERGLHQMIEAKEGCEISGQRKTLAQITYQRFFGRYLLLAGMTGTAKEVAPELKRVYDLSVTKIPTHKPSRRMRLADRLFETSDKRWEAVANRAIEVAAQGRSVLIGTRSVEASEVLNRLLESQGVEHAILNARQDKEEAEAVSNAGQAGRITVATNMAGRGTDIKLSSEVAENGGLHVILTEFHESARVDRQLFGRSARQGDPGSVEAMVSFEDELFRQFVPYLSVLLRPYLLKSGGGSALMFKLLVGYAQLKAERHNRKTRLAAVDRDRQWLAALGFVGRTKK
jgi:preprotein translocase subunit SecA